jgi:hypothetical protein
LVKLIEDELDEAEAIEEFATKLASLGYAPLPDYDGPTFVNSGTQAYEVVEGFPRLVRSSLPVGIARVSYQIQLETIAPYECAMDVALGV